MSYKNAFEGRIVLQILLLALVMAFTANTSWAQDVQAEDAADAVEQAADEATDDTDDSDEEEAVNLDKVVVTGSRLQRQTYSSIAPMQIITAEGAREAGLVDAAAILQTSTFSAGQQIDLTFGGFVLDNGPDASTASLRGLGAARTLLLMNGRRLAPSGVEGAPSAPNLDLIPAALVEQYEILLDGASSIYGSDAVAGVINLIMRKDFDGLEVDLIGNIPDGGAAGDHFLANVTWGKNFDRGFVGVGLSYEDQEAITLDDRKWTAGCDRHAEVDQDGKFRSQDLWYQQNLGMTFDDCRLGSLAGRVIVPTDSGSIYYTPGFSNGGWGNFSESSNPFFTKGVDGDGDGVTDVNFRNHDINGKDQGAHLIPEEDILNIMAYGEYAFEGEANNTAFFEANYSDRNFFRQGGQPQFFPFVPATNPYNICNPDAEGGVDCGEAQDALYTNPNFITDFAANFEGLCASFGIPLAGCTPATFGLLTGPLGPLQTRPVVAVAGDRDNTRTETEQIRVVLGLKGDLPFMNNNLLSNWVYETSFSYQKSDSDAHRVGIREDRYDYSVETSRVDANGNIVCGNNDGCVPINMFAPSLYEGVVGSFATQAERDYLFDSRDFNTKYTQTVFSAFASGFMGELQGGTILAGLGVELRTDDIDSIPDDIARDGLFFGFFSDGGAVGDKWTREAFGEIELPFFAGKPFAEELVLNLSGRWTDDEIYGSDTTGSAKLGWRPIPSLLLRATYGTSFRAPNLREVFLQDQSGFGNISDPCIVPAGARNALDGSYNPSGDTREAQVLANCVAQGVDPTQLDNNGFSTLSTEIATGGSLDLEAETSDSFTYGFAFEQPWFDTFDLSFGATYYEITINNTIIEPSGQFLVNDCFTDPELDSTFCGAIVRGSDGFIDIINAGFINRDEEKNRGVDINVNFDKTFSILGGKGLRFGSDLQVNHSIEASDTFVDDNGNTNFDDDDNEFGFPNWKGQLSLRGQVDDWTVAWTTNYIGRVRQDADGVDAFDDISGNGDTCLGPPTDVLCRDVGFAKDYWLHSASIAYTADNWVLRGGVRNVFDKEPPVVDGTEVLAINNSPIGVGYDLLGRTFFLNLIWSL